MSLTAAPLGPERPLSPGKPRGPWTGGGDKTLPSRCFNHLWGPTCVCDTSHGAENWERRYAPLVQELQTLREHQPHPEEGEIHLNELLLIGFNTLNPWTVVGNMIYDGCINGARMVADLGPNSSSLSLCTVKTWVTLQTECRGGDRCTIITSLHKAAAVMIKTEN